MEQIKASLNKTYFDVTTFFLPLTFQLPWTFCLYAFICPAKWKIAGRVRSKKKPSDETKREDL